MKKENKFIVINLKRFEEIDDLGGNGTRARRKLLDALRTFNQEYQQKTGKKMNQKYVVCNKDEPYANAVWEIIKAGENMKTRQKR